MLTVVLAPHADDAVLSCGGRLWGLQAAGEPARVITIFAGIPAGDELPEFAGRLHARWGDPPQLGLLRRAEDRAALARLGVADVLQLDELDCIYRLGPSGDPLYTSDAAIFDRVHPEDATLPDRLAAALVAALPARDDCRVLAPLGAGQHVDHQLAYRLSLHLADGGYAVTYYEELPYAALTGAEVSRDHPLGAESLLAAALAARPGWRSTTLALGEAALAAKVDAMAYYRSQLPVLFGDDLAMSRALRGYAASVAPPGAAYGERLWSPPDDPGGPA
jgi:LmbE family N-acetylglucosaminyl deacetylase